MAIDMYKTLPKPINMTQEEFRAEMVRNGYREPQLV